MRDARRLTIAGIGSVVALAGFEHGLGELLQGPIAPPSVFIQSWPDSAFFSSLSGEPAMTLIPNLAVSGVMTMALSVAFLVWVLRFTGVRHTSMVIAGLSIALLLVGGGFGPPVLGLITAAAALKVRSPLNWWRSRTAMRDALAFAWPASAIASVVLWLVMLFGVAALSYFTGFENETFTWSVLGAAFVSLPIAFVTSWAHDARTVGLAHS